MSIYTPWYITKTSDEYFNSNPFNSYPVHSQYLVKLNGLEEVVSLFTMDAQYGEVGYIGNNDFYIWGYPLDGSGEWYVGQDGDPLNGGLALYGNNRWAPPTKQLGLSGSWEPEWGNFIDPSTLEITPYVDVNDEMIPLEGGWWEENTSVWYEQQRRNRQND